MTSLAAAHHTSTAIYDFSRNRNEAVNVGGRPPLPREHGTERGYQQHRTDRTRACGRCLHAHQIHNTDDP